MSKWGTVLKEPVLSLLRSDSLCQFPIWSSLGLLSCIIISLKCLKGWIFGKT